MKSTTVKTEALYEDGKIDTLGKPYSACSMVFGPHGGDEWVFGTTEEVRTYWDSLTCSIDFNWFVFDTESEMMDYLKEIDKLYSGCLSVAFHKAKDCELVAPPNWKNTVRVS